MNSSSKSTTNNNNSNDSDDLSDFEEDDEGDYEDDEATLDEEEQLAKGANASDEEDGLDNADELRLLAEEGEMSVEELKRKYLGCDDFAPDSGSPSSSDNSHEIVGSETQPGCSTAACSSSSTSADKYGYFALKTSALYEGGEDEEEDEEYSPPEFWKKSARIGSEFQANLLPKFVSSGRDASNSPATSSTTSQYFAHPAEAMWIPAIQICPLDQVERYLFDCEKIRLECSNSSTLTTFPVPHARNTQSLDPAEVFDDENALYSLLKKNYNVEKAKTEAPFPWPSLQCVNGARRTYTEPWRPFNEEDCAEFESALRAYGKNFWAIKKNKMSDRTVGELIRFYYIWKKTERHDIFVERNKQAHQSQRSAVDSVNTTDFMGGIMDVLNGGIGNNLAPSTKIELETTSTVHGQVSNSLGTNIHSSPMSSSKGWLHVGNSNATPASSSYHNKGQ